MAQTRRGVMWLVARRESSCVSEVGLMSHFSVTLQKGLTVQNNCWFSHTCLLWKKCDVTGHDWDGANKVVMRFITSVSIGRLHNIQELTTSLFMIVFLEYIIIATVGSSVLDRPVKPVRTRGSPVRTAGRWARVETGRVECVCSVEQRCCCSWSMTYNDCSSFKAYPPNCAVKIRS